MSDRLPDGLEKYFETAVFTEHNAPQKIKERHQSKEGVWARIVLLSGELDYIVEDSDGSALRLMPGIDGIIRPTEPHRVATVGPVEFKIEFYRRARE